MKILFWLIIGFIGVVAPLFLILLDAGRTGSTSLAALGAGACAFSLMAINLFLATRPRIIEKMAGGLDRIYQAHKWIGISLFPLLFIHAEVGMDIDGQIVSQGMAKTAVEIAEFVYWPLLALLGVSWIKRFPRLSRDVLPYHIWRWSHRALGFVFIAIFVHQFFVKLPFNANATVAQYLNFMGVIGIMSFLYTQFLAPLRPRLFEVISVEKRPTATIITARPVKSGIRKRPGGFSVISFKQAGLREPHPFTVSRMGDLGEIEFSIRGLGDYTKRLRDKIKPGDAMTVEGPYGRFDYTTGERDQLWIAGGIGITPFLSFVDALDTDETRRISLLYCVRSREEAIGLERLEAAACRVGSFNFRIHESAKSGRLDAAELSAGLPFDLSSAGLWYCGPEGLRKSLLKSLRTLGKSPKSVYFEEFEFR